MFAAYGVDVLDRRLTPRRLKVLLERLPAGYWPDRDESASWSVEAHLLAGVIDAIQWNTWASMLPHVKGKPAKPKPIRRPGDRKRRRPAGAAANGNGQKRSSVADLAHMARVLTKREGNRGE